MDGQLLLRPELGAVGYVPKGLPQVSRPYSLFWRTQQGACRVKGVNAGGGSEKRDSIGLTHLGSHLAPPPPIRGFRKNRACR